MNNKCGCQYTMQQCELQLKWSSLYNYLPFDEWYNIFDSRKLMHLAVQCARFVMMLRCSESSTITCSTTVILYGTSVCNLQFFCLFFFICQVALLCGPPGLGKTTLAHVIAQHAGYNVVEMNARWGNIQFCKINAAHDTN